ncbi:hypothetical protein MMC30_003401 [Trapelia coarctata]|nr:hypothetical protein [Trapelia coarctata]
MPSIRSLLLSCLLLSRISSYVISEPIPEEEADREALSDLEAFQQLLDQVDPPALHAALHDFTPKKFKHGVFKEDRTAVEAVHRDDASMATSILALAKRADPGNSTVPGTTVTVIDSTVTESINPTTIPGNPVQPSDRSTVPATPSPQTPTPVGPETNTQSPVSTAVVLVTSTATPSATASLPFSPGPISIPKPSTSLAPGMVLTTTNAAGVTVVTTIDGGVITLSGPAGAGGSTAPVASVVATSFTSVVLQTTTLANGVQSTITAITVIQAGNTAVVTPSGSAGAGSSTTGPAAGLQTGLAPRSRSWGWEAVGVLGGAVGFAMVL